MRFWCGFEGTTGRVQSQVLSLNSRRVGLAAVPKSGTFLEMAKHTSFSLGGHFTAFIEAEVSKGRYASASEVVRAGLRLLEEREAHLARLRAALIEGEESGPSEPFDFDAFLADQRAGR